MIIHYRKSDGSIVRVLPDLVASTVQVCHPKHGEAWPAPGRAFDGESVMAHVPTLAPPKAPREPGVDALQVPGAMATYQWPSDRGWHGCRVIGGDIVSAS